MAAPERPRLRSRLLVQGARGLLGLLFFLNRKVVLGEEFLTQARARGKPVFVGLWHDRMIYPLWYLCRYRPLALVSRSRDGDVIAGLLEAWGYRTIRGSSSRGSRQVLRAMMRLLDTPDLVMVNAMDGPVGPARVAKVGGLALAARKGAVLIPVNGAASRHWMFKQSWDHFQIPKPFGRIVIQFGPPVELVPGMADEDLARLMGRRIDQAGEQADAHAAHLG